MAVAYLSRLSRRYPEACIAIERMAASPDPESRLAALRCLAGNSRSDTALVVSRRLITDPAPRVREAAAMRAAVLRCRELFNELGEQLEIEPIAAVRNAFQIARGLLRDGYAFQTMPDGHRELHALCREGIVSTWVDEATLQKIGLPEYVRQWRQF